MRPANVRAMSDVVLVCMPFAAVQRPSIALGTLQAILARAEISCRSFYANLHFADEIGTAAYAFWEDYIGDLVFSHLLFPEFTPRKLEQWVRYRFHLGRDAARPAGLPEDDAGVMAAFQDIRATAGKFIEKTAREVLALRPKIVGCTSMYWQHAASLALLRRIHELDPSVVTMVGGANCEGVMGRATHQAFDFVDFAVSGEADDFVAKFFQDVLARGRVLAADEIPFGVFGPLHRLTEYPRAPGGDDAPRAACKSLKAVPTPDYDDYFETLKALPLADHVKPGLLVEAARGCWWGAVHHCTFCGISDIGMQYHAKSAEQFLGELNTLQQRHGISDFEVTDNILHLGYFKSVIPALAGKGRNFFWETKANLKREQVDALAAAGVKWLQPGVESLDSRVLALMDKGVQAVQNLRLLRWCRERGIRVQWNVLWGFPGEEDDWYAETAKMIPLLQHLQPPRLVIRIRYDRYSVYQARATEFGLDLVPSVAMRMTYDLPPELLTDLTYYFDSRTPEAQPGPGVRSVRRAVQTWLDAFWKQGLHPLLGVEDDGQALHFIDTRACATEVRYRVDGAARLVYLACEDGSRPSAISTTSQSGMDAPRNDGVPTLTAEDVAAALEILRARGVVAEVDGRLLALGLRGDVPALDPWFNFPGGHMALQVRERSRA